MPESRRSPNRSSEALGRKDPNVLGSDPLTGRCDRRYVTAAAPRMDSNVLVPGAPGSVQHVVRAVAARAFLLHEPDTVAPGGVPCPLNPPPPHRPPPIRMAQASNATPSPPRASC